MVAKEYKTNKNKRNDKTIDTRKIKIMLRCV